MKTMNDEIEVTVYIPREAIKEHGMGGCTVDLSFCDRNLCQATMRDGDDDKSLYFDNGLIEDIGEISDGFHTFNQLYYQRAVLFACIVNLNKDKAWKSFKHSDGEYCFDSNGEWFIVGVDTPQGSYTYHYEKKYWYLFDCEELPCGKEWDGHTEEDVTRLLSLKQELSEDVISRQALLDKIHDVDGMEALENSNIFAKHYADMVKSMPSVISQPKIGRWIKIKDFNDWYKCSECGRELCGIPTPFCDTCGAKMEGVKE